jgi:hypothetical protein
MPSAWFNLFSEEHRAGIKNADRPFLDDFEPEPGELPSPCRARKCPQLAYAFFSGPVGHRHNPSRDVTKLTHENASSLSRRLRTSELVGKSERGRE